MKKNDGRIKMTERRKTITERIDEVYSILHGMAGSQISILGLAISMDMSSKYLREEIIPAALLVYTDIEMKAEKNNQKNNPSKIFLFLPSTSVL